LKPVVDRVFPFEEARAAYEYQASGAHFGKVVIAV
jgi:NADPH:quinone reductase-like Zn-dependent oxidoreductase